MNNIKFKNELRSTAQVRTDGSYDKYDLISVYVTPADQMQSLKITRPGRNGSSVSYEPSTDPDNINNKVKFMIFQGKGVRINEGVIEGAGTLLKSGTFGYNDAVSDRDILAEDDLKLTGGLATGDGEYYTFLFYNDEDVNSPPIYYEFVSSLTYEPQPEPEPEPESVT